VVTHTRADGTVSVPADAAESPVTPAATASAAATIHDPRRKPLRVIDRSFLPSVM
jgi:hypothetical protein